eukprot:6482297-Amphidinium_carterae.1
MALTPPFPMNEQIYAWEAAQDNKRYSNSMPMLRSCARNQKEHVMMWSLQFDGQAAAMER